MADEPCRPGELVNKFRYASIASSACSRCAVVRMEHGCVIHLMCLESDALSGPVRWLVGVSLLRVTWGGLPSLRCSNYLAVSSSAFQGVLLRKQ